MKWTLMLATAALIGGSFADTCGESNDAQKPLRSNPGALTRAATFTATDAARQGEKGEHNAPRTATLLIDIGVTNHDD